MNVSAIGANPYAQKQKQQEHLHTNPVRKQQEHWHSVQKQQARWLLVMIKAVRLT